MAVTCSWTNSFDANYSACVTDTTKMDDVGANDHTTYEEVSASPFGITVVWDLGTSSTVTRIVSSMYASLDGSFSNNFGVSGSNDGNTWVDPTTGFTDLPYVGWKDKDTTSVGATTYRYWRLSTKDNSGGTVRIGHFRLYNGATPYTISGSVVAGRALLSALSVISVSAGFPRQNIQY